MRRGFGLIPVLIVALLMAVVAGVVLQNNKQSDQIDSKDEFGFLAGKVTIGPLCPSLKFPETDPSCKPTEETYQAWPVGVWSPNKETKIAQLEPDLNSSYKLELPVGEYIVDFEKQLSFGIGGNDLPASVEINSGQTTYLDINIDTGIR